MWRTLEHDGKLAVTLGWSPDWAEPQESRTLYVSPVSAQDAAHLIGLERGECVGGDALRFWRAGANPVYLETSKWRRVVEHRPCPKPRRRGAWGWWGGWHRL